MITCVISYDFISDGISENEYIKLQPKVSKYITEELDSDCGVKNIWIHDFENMEMLEKYIDAIFENLECIVSQKYIHNIKFYVDKSDNPTIYYRKWQKNLN